MIVEDFVSFEVAKLLKEKGFDEYCLKNYWSSDKELHDWKWELSYKRNSDGNRNTKDCAAPTHQMAMKWLRENHNIHIVIEAYPHEDGCFYWCYRIMEMVKIETLFGYFKKAQKSGFDSYEDAVEAALKYCLEEMI